MTNPAAWTESIGLPGQLFLSSFFAALLINLIMTGQLRFIYRDLQKNSPAPGQAATNHTGWPLGCNNIFTSICPLAPGKVCGSTVTNS
jgi:hypothetical protein